MSLELKLNYFENNFKVDKSSNNKIYRFEEFTLDAAHLMLSRNGGEIPLFPKAVETLRALVEQRGKILSKAELMDAIWADSVVEESNLAQYLHILRKTLGNQQNGQPFIETLRRRGYRFNGEVEVIEIRGADPGGNDGTHQVGFRPTSPPPRTVRIERHGNVLAVADWNEPDPETQPVKKPRFVVLGIVVLAALAVLAVVFSYLSSREVVANDAPIDSLAILPFKPLASGGVDDDAFRLGLADALILRLGSSRHLTVRQLGAVKRFDKLEIDAAEVGRKLGTKAVLDGTYQRVGDRVRFNLRLVSAEGGKVLWSGQFDERSSDTFAMQDSIATRVASALASGLSNSSELMLAKRGTSDEEAFRLYQRGRYLWNQRTFDGASRAIRSFEEAIARDPQFARAYAGLADALMFSPSPEGTRMELTEKAREKANQAIRLDPQLAEPQASLGLIAINSDWDFVAGESHLRRAIDLDPNYATAHHWLGDVCLAQSGRFDEALVELHRARDLDPLSPIINADIGKALYLARRYDEAIGQLGYSLELDPSLGIAHMWMALSYLAKSDPEAAKKEAAMTDWGDPFLKQVMAEMINAAGDKKSEARTNLERLLRNADKKTQDNNACAIAYVYSQLGDNERAIEWLEREFANFGVGAVGLKTVPLWDPIRQDPRFQQLLKRIRFS